MILDSYTFLLLTAAVNLWADVQNIRKHDEKSIFKEELCWFYTSDSVHMPQEVLPQFFQINL